MRPMNCCQLSALRIFLLSLLFPFFTSTSARQFNVTIDDQDGDPTNGNHIIYTPDGAWSVGQNCSGCTAKPSPQSDAYLGTWMDATFNPAGTVTNSVPDQIIQASVNFVGTAVYVICILTGSSTSPDGNTDMTFIIDGSTVSSFEKAPNNDTSYNFNQTVFSQTGLSNGSHTLQLQSGHAGNKALVLLDAVIYTVNDGIDDGDGGSSSGASPTSTSVTSTTASPLLDATTKHKSHTGAIAGGIVAALAVLGLLCALLFFMRRRRQHQPASANAQLDAPGPGPGPQMATTANIPPSSAVRPSYVPVPSDDNAGTRPSAAYVPTSSAAGTSYAPTHTHTTSTFSGVSYNPHSVYNISNASSDPFRTPVSTEPPSTPGARVSHASFGTGPGSTSGSEGGGYNNINAGGNGYYGDTVAGALVGAAAGAARPSPTASGSGSSRPLPSIMTSHRPPLPRGAAPASVTGSSSSYAVSITDADGVLISPPAYSTIDGFEGRNGGASGSGGELSATGVESDADGSMGAGRREAKWTGGMRVMNEDEETEGFNPDRKS